MGDLSWILGKHNEPARQAEIVAPGHRRASVMVDQSRPLVRAGVGEQPAPMNLIRCGRQDGLTVHASLERAHAIRDSRLGADLPEPLPA
jgi:hypothetical protein